MTQDQIKQAIELANKWCMPTYNELNLVQQALLLRDAQLAVALEALDQIYRQADMIDNPWASDYAKDATKKIKDMETR